MQIFVLKRSEADHSFFYCHTSAGKCVYLMVYVDYIVIKGNDRDKLPSDDILSVDIYKAIDYLRNSKTKTFEIDYTKLQ